MTSDALVQINPNDPPFVKGLDENGNETVFFSIQKLIGAGYNEYWWFTGRYCVVKGGRNSKKSWTTAYWIILHMMQMPYANTLVVRKIGDNNKDSTYALLCGLIYKLGVEDRWKMKSSPLELIYRPTGQKILFRGADKPMKISSITVSHGVLCWAWVEEAYQITNERDFDIIDQSIRGLMPEGYYPHIFITFNPWHKEHWLKTKFFDKKRKDTLAITTNYLTNEFVSEADKAYFENLRETNPRLYQVAGLGDWGVSEGLILTDWEERDFDKDEIAKRESAMALYGLDFGFTDPTAFVASIVDKATRTIYVYDEWYQRGVTNIDIFEKLTEMGYAGEHIVCDNARPDNIYELQRMGMHRIVPSIKGQDSIEYGIQKMQQYHYVIHPRCVNFLTEVGMYCYAQDAMGKMMNKPIDDFNHGIDAHRYSLMELLYRTGVEDGFVVGPSTDQHSERYRTRFGLDGEKRAEDSDEDDDDDGDSGWVF